MSEIISHTQCPSCASHGKDTDGNNLALWETGWKYCIACEYKEAPSGDARKERKEELAGDLVQDVGRPEAIASRRLTVETCRKYGITTVGSCVIFPIKNSKGVTVGQKVKNLKTGNIKQYGNVSDGVLFGRDLFEQGGKRVVVTEGELDAPSVFQVLSTKSQWPVVSIIRGASNNDDATKVVNEIKANFDWLNSFDEVVFCFDNDEAGQKSAKAAAAMFSPGKAHVTKLTLNDPSDYLQGNKSSELYKDVWGSPKWKPPSIVAMDEVASEWDIGGVRPYLSNEMTRRMLGRKDSTATLVGSGTGSGKSTLFRTQAFEDGKNGVRTGCIFLEESPTVTQWEMAGMVLNKPVREIMLMRKLLEDCPHLGKPWIPDDLTDAELKEAMEYVRSLPIHLCNLGEGSKPEEILLNVEHMVVGLGCQEIVLDHISRVQVNDNKELDQFGDKLIALIERLPAHLTAISQLNQGDSNKTHEEGKKTTLRDFRGSQILVSLFHEVIAFSRNQQAENPEDRHIIHIDSLKSRISNYTGPLTKMKYDPMTGVLNTNYNEDPFVNETSSPQALKDFK